MPEYSKIESIEIMNFMSIEKAKLTFDDSNILNIKGYNDSGKSAIMRALAVCLMDMFRMKQVKFIRHGAEYFRVVVTFDDGVSVLREKYINGQSLYEMYKGKNRVYTSKQGTRLTRIDGVPEMIADYLGLCVTDSVYFNYQSCTDPLPLVDTKGSSNYQMLHEVLKMEEIYKATQMINKDKNELSSEVADIEQDIQRNELYLAKCQDVTQELIDVLKSLNLEYNMCINRSSDIKRVATNYNTYIQIEEIPEIEKIDGNRLREVTNICNYYKAYESIDDIPEIEKVDTERLTRVQNIVSSYNNFSSIEEIPEIQKIDGSRLGRLENCINLFNNYNSVKEIPTIDLINTDRYSTLSKLYTSCGNLFEMEAECTRIEEKLDRLKKKLDSQVEEARKDGYKIVQCDNCGTYMVVGIEG